MEAAHDYGDPNDHICSKRLISPPNNGTLLNTTIRHQPPECNQMFTEIRLKQFKSYRDVTEVPLAPLTVLIGQNNVGKSSVLQALLLLKQTLDDRGSNAALVTQGQIDVGGFLDIVHRPAKGLHPQDAQFEIGACRKETSGRLQYGKSAGLTFYSTNRLNATFGFHAKSNEIVVNRVEMLANDNAQVVIANDNWSSPHIKKNLSDRVKIRLKHFLPTADPVLAGDMRNMEAVFHFLMVLEWDAQSWYSTFDKLHNIPPTRVRIPFLSAASRRASTDFGPGGENLIMALANNDKIEKSKTLCELVGDWLSKRFKIISNLRIKRFGPQDSVYSLLADDLSGRTEINVAGMGEGISQMLPILARVLSVPKEACLLVEQPELHLHPAAQAEMADLFIDRVQDNRQVVIETHSEHILLRIRRRIAEGAISVKDVAILFVEKTDGASTVTRLDLNDNGHFGDWPKGFFDDGYKEAMALALAQPAR